MRTLHLIVGLPGAGKTTLARRIAAESGGVRLSPDEWMGPLFGDSDADGARDVLEGRLIWTATRILRNGADVILDFGFWGRDERAALHWLAAEFGARARSVYLPVDPETQLARVTQRWRDAPSSTWEIDADMLAEWQSRFQEPEPDELDGGLVAAPPAGHDGWGAWIAERWPSSMAPAG